MSDERTIKPNSPADFTPQLGDYKTLQPFRYWCQKVLPLVYDDSLSYYELLCKVVDYLNKTMEDVETLHGDVNNLHTAYTELENYVNNYFASLDVQAEINNKLDSMVEDGSLSALLSNIILPTLPPLVVNSLADMTNTIRTYILKSNSHIYTYDGNNWVDSGLVYGSTIGNVYTQFGLVTTNNYASVLPDVNNINVPCVYILNFNYGSTSLPKNLPYTSATDPVQTLITYGTGVQDGESIYPRQVIISDSHVWTRRSTGTTWGEWVTLLDLTLPKYNYYKQLNLVTSTNYASVLPDVNNISDPCVYMLNFNYGSTSLPKNLPYTTATDTVQALITYGTGIQEGESIYPRQLIISDSHIWTRYGTGSTWQPWVTLLDLTLPKYNYYKQLNLVTNTNYTTVLPDVNSINEPCVYILNFGYGSTNIPKNLPYTSSTYAVQTLITYGTGVQEGESIYPRQMLVTDSHIWTRWGTGDGNWQSWKTLIGVSDSDNLKTYYVGSDKEYTSLTKFFKEHSGENCNVYVDSGTYNLYNEFVAEYSNFADGTGKYEGLIVDGVNVYMKPDTIISFEYTGSVENIKNLFSPFKFSNKGGSVRGGQIIAKNCRYCVHDDVYDGATSNSLISGCFMYKKADTNAVVIGGGFGKTSNIKIENCIIKQDTDGYGIFYHNSAGTGLSNLIVTGNYCNNGTIMIEGYGPSTEKSRAIVTNNKSKGVNYLAYNDADNIELIEFNNVTI